MGAWAVVAGAAEVADDNGAASDEEAGGGTVDSEGVEVNGAGTSTPGVVEAQPVTMASTAKITNR
jgi:hypothetical protein